MERREGVELLKAEGDDIGYYEGRLFQNASTLIDFYQSQRNQE